MFLPKITIAQQRRTGGEAADCSEAVQESTGHAQQNAQLDRRQQRPRGKQRAAKRC
jgi:hypothetical protein